MNHTEEHLIVPLATLQIYQTPKNLTANLSRFGDKHPKKSWFCPSQAGKEEATSRKGTLRMQRR